MPAPCNSSEKALREYVRELEILLSREIEEVDRLNEYATELEERIYAMSRSRWGNV